MSAINPASFQTPVGGLQIPGTAAQGVSNGEVEKYVNRRQQRQQPTSVSPRSTQAVAGVFDHVWDASREGNTTNALAFPHPYSQSYLPQGYDLRQLEQYPMEYRQGVQQMLNMHSIPQTPGYHVQDLRHSSSFTSRPDSSNSKPQGSHDLGRDWNQVMQGLSLGP